VGLCPRLAQWHGRISVAPLFQVTVSPDRRSDAHAYLTTRLVEKYDTDKKIRLYFVKDPTELASFTTTVLGDTEAYVLALHHVVVAGVHWVCLLCLVFGVFECVVLGFAYIACIASCVL
jgi:hypothetical protein